MTPLIICCKTIEKELLAAMEQSGCDYPILWLDSGLHARPDKLRNRIQELLDNCHGFDTVLLALSFCGNSVAGLRTHDFRLVIPRSDDCITLLLDSQKKRLSVPAAFFLTEGWLTGDLSFRNQRRHFIEDYGDEFGEEIFSAMFGHYKKLALVDTGCSDSAAREALAREMAEEMGLEYVKMEGSLNHIKELLAGNWNEERFVLVPPNSVVTADMCTL